MVKRPVTAVAAATAGVFPLRVAVLAAVAAYTVLALVGALLGGKAGMHYHRKVDAAGFRDEDDTDRR